MTTTQSRHKKDKYLALDVGDKTVGVAISDELGTLARGLFTLERVGIRKDCGKIIDCIRENNCSVVVVGLPLNLDGTDSVQTEKVREFEKMLSNKLRSVALQDVLVEFYDERWTSKIADRVMMDAGVSRAKRDEIIDQQAAVIILQDYLESKRK
jgi:putative Holliday junction resolvase